jgi:hypothetical protein
MRSLQINALRCILFLFPICALSGQTPTTLNVNLSGSYPSGSYVFSSSETYFNGRLSEGNLNFSERAVGVPLSLSGGFSGSGISGSSGAVINGQRYEYVWFSGSIGFNVAPFVYPRQTNRQLRTKKLPAIGNVNLRVYLCNPFSCSDPPIANYQTVLQGTVSVSYRGTIRQGSEGRLMVKVVSCAYDF